MLKAKLAKLRKEALEGPKSGGNAAERSFEVVKHGDARVAVVGFPSTGKSTFLSAVTNTESEAASCKFLGHPGSPLSNPENLHLGSDVAY